MEPLISQQTLIEAVNSDELQAELETRFFFDRYFKPTADSALSTPYVRLEVSEKGDGMSTFNLPRTQATIVGENAINPKIYEPPLIKEKIPFNADELVHDASSTGVITLSGDTSRSRMERRIANAMLKLRNRVHNREEWMAVNTMSGGWSYSNTLGVDLTVDFDFDAANKVTLAGGDIWGSGTEDIQGDIDAGIAQAELYGGRVTEIIFGRNAWAMFAKDANIRDLYDKNNIRIGAVDLSSTDKYRVGTYAGRDLFVVSERVRDSSGTTTELVNPNGVWFVNGNLSTDIVYAAMGFFENNRPITAQIPYYMKEYVEGEDIQTLFLLIASRPFTIIENPESIVYYDVA